MSDSTTATEPTTEADAAADQGDDTQATATVDSTTTIEDPEGAEHLGDPGKKALDAMKARVKAAEDAKRASDTAARDLAARLKALEDAEADRNRTEEERAAAQAQRNAEQAAIAKANQRLLRADVRSAAAGKLRDPADALAFLDLASLSITEDGDTDPQQIDAAIADLLEKRPYLGVDSKPTFAKQDTAATKTKDAAGPKQLTREDLKTMTASQINDARRKGQLDTLMKGA